MSESLIRARLISWLVADYLNYAKNPIASRAKFLENEFNKMSIARLQILVDKTPTNKRRENVYDMANYLIEFEHDDFYYSQEEPCENHIYYKAYEYINGELEAKEMLAEAIKEWKDA